LPLNYARVVIGNEGVGIADPFSFLIPL
jgi:hypothetical protein